MNTLGAPAKMQQGFVHLPKDAPRLDDYLRELTRFPSSRPDGQMDSTTRMEAEGNKGRTSTVD